MTPQELAEHLKTEHNAPDWVLLTGRTVLAHVHDLDHQTRADSDMPDLTHDHNPPDLRVVPTS